MTFKGVFNPKHSMILFQLKPLYCSTGSSFNLGCCQASMFKSLAEWRKCGDKDRRDSDICVWKLTLSCCQQSTFNIMASSTDTELSVLLPPLCSRNIAWSNFTFLKCKAKRKLYRVVWLSCFKFTSSFQETLPWSYRYCVSAYKRDV